MDQPSLYDDHTVTWADQQVAALRSLATRPELSNVPDWENVAEEIEGVGRSEIDRVESAMSQMLIHVLKYASAPAAQSTRSWRKEVLVFQASAQRNYRPFLRQRIDWERLWANAKTIADASLDVFGGRLIGGLPDRMPFTPEEMSSDGFDMDRALERLAEVLKARPDHH
ncbi:hypothetical protein AFCDBAGC_4222 [Methylobacterium cerastii]|uniref:DUF29 domain-containing protein n=1 Tax=Methylobacterium cerastii TaxID=932741 RepID=A0ABQ4QNB5_9HYPH|nr:DUF29 domain-containing protein [Methylobacterium cerastii]GJD46342.1 hypothetical protein AFCDBAGC_4222 [Methylobacterium cerastii]